MKKKVIQFVGSLGNGGVENFVINTCKNLSEDLFDVSIYTLSSSNKYYYQEAIDNDIKIIDNFDSAPKNRRYKNIMLLRSVLSELKKNKYDIAHIHVNSELIPIIIACKIANIPKICVHSHAAYSPYWNPSLFPIKSKFIIALQKILIKNIATDKLGCSRSACNRLYGEQSIDSKVIFNGIDFDKFNKELYGNRDKDSLNFVHIGRFNEEKNQKFLIDIWSKLIQKYNDKNIKLFIVGYGELEDELNNYIKVLNLENSIKMLNQDTNIPKLLHTADYFILPSLYEGLGIVLIEAQAMGVTCFASDNVPQEANLGLCNYISLEKSADEWAEYIFKYEINDNKLSINNELLDKYNIKNVSKLLESIYLN